MRTHLGELVIEGEIHAHQKNVAYIPELFGNTLPSRSIKGYATCSFILPGYEKAKLAPKCKGSMLTWKEYGQCVAEALQHVQQEFTLIGCSKGAMVALYASTLAPKFINRVIVYKIPLFGSLRAVIKDKYAGISQRIVNEETFLFFLDKIRDQTPTDIMKVIKRSGWENAKKLYEGASVSEMDINTLKRVSAPIVLVEDNTSFDKLHSRKAFDLLYEKLPKGSTTKVLTLKQYFESNT